MPFYTASPRKGYMVRWCVRVFSFIQGHRNWYPSKAHMRLLINIPFLTIFLFSIRDITTYWSKISIFAVLPTQSRLKLSQGGGVQPRVRKLVLKTGFPGLPGVENRVILRACVFTWHRLVTDRRTDRQRAPQSRTSIAERDNKPHVGYQC